MPELRVIIAAGMDSEAVRAAIGALAGLHEVEIAGIVCIGRRRRRRPEVLQLLRRAFPERPFTLDDCARIYGVPLLHEVPDDGLVIAAGMRAKPGWLEVREDGAAVAVGFAGDDGVLVEDAVAVHPNETAATLRRKLDRLSVCLLARAVGQIAAGETGSRPPKVRAAAPEFAPARRPNRVLHALKTLYCAAVYYTGLHALVRWSRRDRAAILLYHRVNDLVDDPLTVTPERFAEHLLVLARHYRVLPTSEFLQALQERRPLPRGAVLIHFDDCYRDVATNGMPLLAAMGFPAAVFIASGFVGTSRTFDHDRKCPFPLENLTPGDVAALIRNGIEVGAHTVNHVDLGACDKGCAEREIGDSKQALERLTGARVRYFSYPFGRSDNVRPEVAEMVRANGFEAMFSAHGGYAHSGSDRFDIPRIGSSGEHRALDVLMDIEGLSLGALARRFRVRRGAG